MFLVWGIVFSSLPPTCAMFAFCQHLVSLAVLSPSCSEILRQALVSLCFYCSGNVMVDVKLPPGDALLHLNRLEQTGTGWNRLEQVGIGWSRLE